MSREIDERIVEMQFHNQQFEKGARESIKTLEELRKGLDLEGAAESFGKVSKVTSKGMDFRKTTRNANLFSRAISTVGKTARGVFNAATFPIQALTNGLQTLGHYTGTVLGFNLANKLVQTGENIVRTFTIDPLKTGWTEYEMKMDSIKTIMTGTVKTYSDMMKKQDQSWVYSEDEHLAYVKRDLEMLNQYADKTIYSFSDMTSNIGKFTNAGVDLDTATQAIMGVSNAAAHAGQGTQQASSAMYNLSQALSTGYLGTRDWLSIENANMATLTFKQTLIDVGLALGQLEKKGDKVFVKGKAEGAKAVEVTAENLRETLQEKWVDKNVILQTLGVYSGKTAAEFAAMGFGWEEALRLEQLGIEANRAATEVRTFSKMFDALKEAAQSGWSMSWEYIFGDMNEATALWTKLNDRFSGILSRSADKRNAILLGWRGLRKTEEGELVRIEGAVDGRTVLLEGFENFLNLFQRLAGVFGSAWKNVFGEVTSETLLKLSKGFQKASVAVTKWFGNASHAGSRASKLSQIFEGLFAGLRLGKDVVVELGKRGWDVLKKLLPSSQKLFDKVMPFTDWIKKLSDQFHKDKSFKNLFKTIQEDSQKYFGKLKASWSKTFTDLGTVFKEKGLGAAIQEGKNRLKQYLMSEWGIDVSPIEQLIAKIKKPFSDLTEYFKNLLGLNGENNADDISALGLAWEGIKQVLEDWGVDVPELEQKIEKISGPFNKISTAIHSILDIKATDFQDWWNQVIEIITGVGKEKVEAPEGDATDGVTDAANILDKVVSVFSDLKEAVDKFVGFAQNADWSDLANKFTSFITDMGLGLMMLGAGGAAIGTSQVISGVSGTIKQVGKLVKGVRGSTITVLDGAAEVTIGGESKLDQILESGKEAIGKTGSTVKVILEFAGAMYLLVESMEKLSKLDENDRTQAMLSIGILTGIITAFDGITKLATKKIGGNTKGALKGVSLTGIIGYIAAMHELVNDVVKISEIKPENLDNANQTVLALSGIIGAFDIFEKYATKKIGSSKSTNLVGMIGYIMAIHELTNDVIKLSDVNGGDLDRANKSVTGLTAVIAAFDIFEKYGTSKIGSSKSANLVGMIGYIMAIHELTNDVIKLSDINGGDLDRANKSVAGLTAIIAAFDLFEKYGTSQIGSKAGLSLTGMIGYVVAIHELTNDVIKLSEINGQDEARAVAGVAGITAIIAAFSGLMRIENKFLGTQPADIGELIGLAQAIKEFANATVALSQINNGDEGKAIASVAGLTGIISAFRALTRVTDKIGNVKVIPELAELVGLVIAIKGLTDAVVTLSEINAGDEARAEGTVAGLVLLIGAFDALTKLSSSQFGSKGASFTGMIGFVFAIHELASEVAVLGELEPAKVESAGKVLGGLTLLIGAFDAFSKMSSNQFGSKGASLTGLIGFVIAIHELTNDVVKLSSVDGKDTTKAELALTGLTGLITAFGAISKVENKYIGTTNFGSAVADLTSLIGFASAISALTEATTKLASVPEDRLGGATLVIGALEGLILAFKAISEVIDNTLGANTGFLKKTGNGITSILNTMGLLIGIIGLVMAAKALGDVPADRLEGITSAIMQFGGLIAGFAVVITTLGRAGGAGIKGAAMAALSIGVFAALIVTIFAGISALVEAVFGTENVVDALDDAAQVMGKVGEIFGNFLAGIIEPIASIFTGKTVNLTDETDSMTAAVQALEEFGNIGEAINAEGLQNLSNAFDIIGGIANKKINGVAWYSEFFAAEDDIFQVAEKLPELGAKLKGFNDSLGGGNFDISEQAVGVLRSLIEIVELFDKINGFWDGLDFITFINSFNADLEEGKGIGEGVRVNWDGILGAFEGLGSGMNAGIAAAAEELSVQPLIDKLTSGIGESKAQVISAVQGIFSGLDFGSLVFGIEEGASVEPETVEEAAAQAQGIAQALGDLGIEVPDWLNVGTLTEPFSETMDGLADSMGEYGASFKQMYESFGTGSEESGSVAGENYANAYSNKIQTILGTIVIQPVITPILDLSQVEAGVAELNGLIPKDITIGGASQANKGPSFNTINNFKIDTSSIISAIGNVSARVDNVTSAVKNMRLVLDSGAIVGAVNSGIGRLAAIMARR